jgi:hypothetical protein
MDVSEVRRRVRAAIEGAKRDAAGRRERSDAASHAYQEFLTGQAVPMFHQLASALVGEGHRFKVHTPAGSVRLASERAPDDFIELTLDTSVDPPVVLGRTSHSRGRRAVTSERPVREGTLVSDLGGSDVLDYVLAEIGAFL